MINLVSDKPHYENVPFEIPESWEWVTLDFVCSKIGSGSTPKGSNYSESGIPFFRSQNVYNDGLVFEDIKYISEQVHQSMIGTEVKANDLLLNITGGSLGRCAIVPLNFTQGNVSQHVCILRPIVVLSQYIHAFILSSFFAKTMKITGSGREGLPKYNLEKMIFPLPPLAEQQRIIAEVEKWFALIDELEANKEDLKDYIKQVKSKVLDLAIHGKLVPQAPNDEPAIELLKRINPNFKPCDTSHYENLPAGWSVTALSHIIDLFDSKRKPIKAEERAKRIESKEVLYPYYGATGLVGYIDDYLIEGKFLLLGEDGAPFLDPYAEKAYAVEGKFWVNNHAHILRPKIDFDYLKIYLNAFNYHDVAKGTTRLKLTQGDMNSILVTIPPLKEQKRISSFVENVFSLIDTISTEL